MGLHRQAELDVVSLRDEELPAPASLWSRGGREGFEIEHAGDRIHIPHGMLVEQVGNAMRQAAISRLESMNGTQFLATFCPIKDTPVL